MAQWGNEDLANNSPSWGPALVGQPANTVLQNALFNSGDSGRAAISGSTFTVNTTAAVITAASGNVAALYPGASVYVANATHNTSVVIASITNTTSAVLTANAAAAVTAGAGTLTVKQSGATVGVFGVSPAEKANTGGEAAKVHAAGWVLRKELPNGRVQYETLVAMKSITGDSADDDTVLPE